MRDETRPATLYRFFDGEGNLLYVGASIHCATRTGQHQAKDWWAEVARATFEHFPDRHSAEIAERRAIGSEHPRHNRMHREFSVDELEQLRAEREQKRHERLVESARRRTEREEWEAAHYLAAIFCTNCGRGAGAKRQLWVPKGTPVDKAVCSSCGLKTFVRKGKAAQGVAA